MRKAIVIALLGMAVLALASKSQNRGQQHMNRYNNDDDDDNDRRMQQEAKPFRAGNEYTFTYNTQVATGMVAPDTSAEPGMPQQKAVTRMQAQARIQFSSDRHATLELDQIRLGELNDQMPQPDTVKPMRMFEPKQIPQENYRQLQLPTQFIYADGVIERIQFHQQDETWSKNIKRAVLNMIQLNLKKNNAQGLRLAEDLQLDGQDETTQPGDAESFVLPEITIEGECQTLYTVGEQNERDGRFNVTKSINFQRCRKIADVAYGYQTQQQQPQCAQCQQEWYKQQQQERKSAQPQQPHPCDQCDPKEVKEQRLSRATVLRFVLNGDQNQHAIQRSELTSQYVFKNLNAEAGQYGSAMHAIVASELIFRSEHQKSQPSGAQQRQSSDKEETLLFSNQWNVDVKRFYMYGDEEYSRNSPYKDAQNKVQQAEQALRKLVQSVEGNKNGGIEIEAPIQLQRLVETLRMCSQEELKQIERATGGQQRNNNGNSEKQTAEQFFIDALAIAGTRNTIATLVEKILAKEISEAKAAQTLKSLQGLPAPSDAQVMMVQRLCQSEVAHRSPALKQSCWLTLGSMINELCQHKTQKLAQQSIFGTQSGFTSDEICPQDKKQKYREVLTQQFKNADNTYEKVLAVKALGNAGIEYMVNDIEEIINNQEEERIVRAVAIDALRRLRTQMPRKIQSILMPLFQNNREEPELRMVAFAKIMETLPNQQVIDQIAYALTQERSQYVLAFVYNSMKTLAKTQNPVKQEIAKHVQNALKLLNIDDKALKSASGRIQIPIYSQEQNEGVFIDLVAAFSAKSQLPWHIAAELNSVLNDEYQSNDMKLGVSQQNMEQLYSKLQAAFQQTVNAYNNKQLTRGQRFQDQQQSSTLRNIYTALGIKSRRSSMYTRETSQRKQREQDQEQPFAMFNLRIKDTDMAIIPACEQSAPQALKAILNGEKFSLNQILGANRQLNGQHVRKVMASNFNENRAYIATSCGLPLKAQQSTPMIATLEAQAQVNAESSSLNSPLGVKAQLKAEVSLNVAHIQKLECWLPVFATGTGSIRSLEINLPVNAEITVNGAHGLQIKIKVPQNKKVQVLGLHSLPTTYTAEFDQNKKVLREPKIKAIHCPQIEESQREVNTVIGRSAGLPFHVRGHYYRPSKPSNYKQLVQMLMASENQVHVTFEPNQQTPREVILRAQGSHFEKIQSQQPELNNFYAKKNNNRDNYRFEDNDDQFENDDFEAMESHSQRGQKLNSYLNGQYRAGQMYRHALKMSAQTVGGEKECKAQMEIQGACDAKFNFCKVNVEADRTPLENENNKWTLKAEAQILSPESVSSVDQLDQLESRNQKFLAQAECQWGSNNKQHVTVRIEGEQAKKAQWRQIEEKEQRRNKYYKRQTTFLNKFEVDAEYKLQPAAQNMFSRVFETLKANNFWNTQVQLGSGNNQRDRQQGQMKAIFVIDPITQRHANVTVRTPNQAVRIESMELPGQFRPYPLIRPADKSSHSVQQLFNRWATGKRAECTVDGRRVYTFDNVEYNAPISKCYSVLAKDCSDEEPRFVVLMKALDNYNGKERQQQPKKVKVVTPEQSIECQPASKNSQKLQCRVNGQPAEQHNNDAEDQTIEYNNDQRSDVTINVDGVSVRFNGRKAWIKISSQYKNGQCGLCGHYDDEPADEWRMNNNELTEDLAQFHRSYSLQQDDECTQDDQKDFYEQNKKSFSRRRRTSSSSESDEDDSSSRSSESNEDDSQENEWDDQSFDGDNDWYSVSRRSSSQRRNQNNRGQMDRRSNKGQTKPEEQTAVMEMGNSKICFSMEPVKQCPRGTYPANQQEDYDFGYASDDNKRQQKQKKEKESKKVKFACLNRSSEEARRLLREVRRGDVLDMSEHKPTMTEQVPQPQKCRRY